MVDKITPTREESLILWRRRNGYTQQQAAAEYCVSLDRYREWESGNPSNSPRQHLGLLRPHEVCYLLRRRSGKLQREIAAEIGLTRLWVIKMEAGTAPIERLREYWGV